MTCVAALNFVYFGVEFTVAGCIGSFSLFADSIDLLEDASVNGLILVALNWSKMPKHAWHGVGNDPAPPRARHDRDSLVDMGAAFAPRASTRDIDRPGRIGDQPVLLARVRDAGGSLSRAAFLSARRDVLANFAIILAGGMTLLWSSAWADLLIGLGVYAMNLDVTREGMPPRGANNVPQHRTRKNFLP